LSATLIFVGYNLFAGLSDGIDNAAHIGGLLSGFISELILYPQLENDESKLSSESIETFN
jgi:rhomboid protease GluP